MIDQMNPDDAEADAMRDEPERTFQLLRDEVVETIMRISGGDCCEQHVETIVQKLRDWFGEASQAVKMHILRCGTSHHHFLGRGILAVAIHSGLLDNGRYELIERIAESVGTTMPFVQMAEKVLRVSRSYLKSSSLLYRIVESLVDVDKEWRKAVVSISESIARVSFREPDVMVAAAGFALGRSVRLAMGKDTSAMDHSTRLRRLLVRRQLRHLTGAALCRKLQVTYGTVKRAVKDLDDDSIVLLRRHLKNLLVV